MSDSVTKWHEMNEENSPMIFESPDNGKTVTKRPFGGNISERTIVQSDNLQNDIKKEAYTILSMHNPQAVRMANSILDKVDN